MKYFKLIIPFILTLFLSCTAQKKKTMFNEQDYQELHSHKGTENYEIIEIISKNNLAKYEQLDSVSKKIVLKSYYKSDNKTENTYETLKISFWGSKTVFDGTNTILKDGIMFDDEYYRNWIINGDSTKHKYIDPFTNKEVEDVYNFKQPETNYKNWLKKFEELYNKATYVTENSSKYYMKIKKEWYFMKDNLKDSPLDFGKQYPVIEDKDVRMLPLKDLCPSFSIPPEQRDTNLLKEVKYISKQFEKSNRGSGFNFSAGFWYLNIYMPNGETIKIKRYAEFNNPRIQLYKIPKEYGGSDEILFIIQEPEQDFLKEKLGGMYVIRPKNYKQLPEYAEILKKEKQDALKKRRGIMPD